MNFKRILALIILNIYYVNIMGFFVHLAKVSSRPNLASKFLAINSLMDNRLPSSQQHSPLKKKYFKRELHNKKQRLFKFLRIFVDLTKPRHIFIGK
jgi:hypothetical protein